MRSPFFSIVIPTKNRPDRLRHAIRSVLEQRFADFELVVSDNTDPTHAEESAAVVHSFQDPRVRYLQATGQLSMPDNWEFGCAAARGEFVAILTDRSVFRRDALQTVHEEIQRTGAEVVTWWCDQYGRDPGGSEYRRRSVSGVRRRLDSAQVLNMYLHGDPKIASKFLPKLLSACCRRSILDQIRQSPVGRCFLPVSPDYTSGLLILGHISWMLMIEEALYVSCGTGNGASFRRKGDLAARFLSDLGLSPSDLVDGMPSPARFSYAVSLSDFMRVKRALPDRFAGFELDRAQYYVGCLYDYVKSARHGGDFTDELDLLLGALSEEDEQVQRSVRAHYYYPRALVLRPTLAGVRKSRDDSRVAAGPSMTEAPETDDDEEEDGGECSFETVFDALDWDERHPRSRIPAAPWSAPRHFQVGIEEPWWQKRMQKLRHVQEAW